MDVRGGMTILAMIALAASLSPATPTMPGGGATEGTVTRSRFLMGTSLVIEIPGAPEEEIFEAAFGEVGRLEAVLSNWREDSEVSRLNRQVARSPFRCSADLFGALETALRWAEATGGAFDPTVEPLVRRFGLRPAADALPAEAGGLVASSGGAPPRAGAAVVGWRHVRLDAAARTATFELEGMGIDFGGIGKGIALDAAAGILKSHGVRSALLDFGGQVFALGDSAEGVAWTVEVADPDSRQRAAARVRVRDLSLSTSGNSERGRLGTTTGHILDPKSRLPATFTGSVTVAASDGTSADALSTALFVMGPETGARWAEDHGLPAIFLWRSPDGVLRRRATQGFERLAEAAGDGGRLMGEGR